MNFKKKLILYMAVLLNIHGYSQLAMTSRSSLSGNSYLSLDDVWDLTVENNTGIAFNNTVINLKINNNKGLVYEANATPLSITGGGVQNVSKSTFKNIKVEFTDKLFQQIYDSSHIIPSGNYILCYTVYSEKDSMALCSYCKNILIDNILDKEKKKKDILNSVGGIQFIGFYAFGSDSLPKNPGNYFTWRGNPTVEAFEIPVRADFQFNILNGIIDPATSYFNYTFDGDRLRQNLKSKAEKETKERVKKYDKYKLVYDKAQKEITNINDFISNPSVQKDIYLLRLRDSLESVISKKLEPLKDSLLSINKVVNSKADSAKLSVGDTLTRSIKAKKDSLHLIHIDSTYNDFKAKLTIDTLIKRIGLDSTLLTKIPTNTDSLILLINKYKSLDYLALKKGAYDELLKKKEKLKLLSAKADSLRNIPIDKLKNTNSAFLNGVYGVLSKINTLSYGTHVNTTSEFTCHGLPMVGLNFQTTDNGLILQYTNARQTQNSILNTSKYYDKHYSIYGAGYGQKEKWSLKIVYMSIDDRILKKVLPQDSIEFYGPSINRVVSIISKIKITKSISVEAELAGSETVKNKLFYSVAGYDVNPQGMYSPNNTRSIENIITRKNIDYNRYVGYASKINVVGTINKTRTRITAGVRRTGKDFNTYGNPMLFKNTLSTDLKITQPLYRNNIKFGVIFKYNNFYKDSTSETLKTFCQYGVDLSVNFPKYPTLRVLCIPTQQMINGQALILNSVNLISTYNYKIKRTKNLLTVTGLVQNTSKNAINNYYFKCINSSASNITQFNTWFSTTIRYSYNLVGFNQYLNYLHCTELSGNYTIPKTHWTFNAAILYNIANDNRKIGSSIEVQHPISRVFSFTFRVEKNSYNNYINNPLYPQQYNFPSYNEWLMYASLNLKW